MRARRHLALARAPRAGVVVERVRRADFVYVNGDHLMIMFVLAPVNGGVAKVAGAVLGGILTGSLGWACVFHVALAAPSREAQQVPYPKPLFSRTSVAPSARSRDFLHGHRAGGAFCDLDFRGTVIRAVRLGTSL